MSRFFSACLFFALASVLALRQPAYAQGNAETVNIPTADGVKLRGLYYPADNKCLATVIMLHPIGEGKKMGEPEWKRLAETLQKNGYSVLMFDFRGHGDSTEIMDEKAFWGAKATGGITFPNAANVKTKVKDTIEVKDYIKQSGAYLPVLCNDIAAARAFLDRRNDSNKDCNTSSLIVLGAETGATLGAIWINSEWDRYKTTLLTPVLKKKASAPEGPDIIGAVFLSPSNKLSDSRPVKLSSILKVPCKDKAMALGIFVGEEDKKATDMAVTLEKALKVPDSNKHRFIGLGKLKTGLSGVKLLSAKSLETEKHILDYLDKVVDDRKAPWVEREYDKSDYYWVLPKGSFPAKRKTDKTPMFDDYNKFISQ